MDLFGLLNIEVSLFGVELTVVELSWFVKELSEIMQQAYGLVAMRFYVTKEEAKADVTSAEGDIKTLESTIVPTNLVPFLRNGRPSLTGLVEQAVEEGKVMGRIGIATSGARGLNVEVKNAVAKNLSKDMPDIYCHSEEFGY